MSTEKGRPGKSAPQPHTISASDDTPELGKALVCTGCGARAQVSNRVERREMKRRGAPVPSADTALTHHASWCTAQAASLRVHLTGGGTLAGTVRLARKGGGHRG